MMTVNFRLRSAWFPSYRTEERIVRRRENVVPDAALSLLQRNQNPVWNEMFAMTLGGTPPHEVDVQMKVYDHDNVRPRPCWAVFEVVLVVSVVVVDPCMRVRGRG